MIIVISGFDLEASKGLSVYCRYPLSSFACLLNKRIFDCRFSCKIATDHFHMTSRRPYLCAKQRNGGCVGVPQKSYGDETLFSCKNFFLF